MDISDTAGQFSNLFKDYVIIITIRQEEKKIEDSDEVHLYLGGVLMSFELLLKAEGS